MERGRYGERRLCRKKPVSRMAELAMFLPFCATATTFAPVPRPWSTANRFAQRRVRVRLALPREEKEEERRMAGRCGEEGVNWHARSAQVEEKSAAPRQENQNCINRAT